jgi:hypothetical protein
VVIRRSNSFDSPFKYFTLNLFLPLCSIDIWKVTAYGAGGIMCARTGDWGTTDLTNLLRQLIED